MLRWLSKRSRRAFFAGLGLGLFVGAGMLVGALTGRHSVGSSPFDGMKLNAVGTNSGDTFSMCTGPIADGMEGIFFLDFLTGDLQCLVPNARTGALGGAYKYNVMTDLGVEPGATKKPQFLMVTGLAAFRATGGDPRPAECILYIADAHSGNWVSYSLPWSRNAASNGLPQGGTLIKIGTGKARNLELRGQ